MTTLIIARHGNTFEDGEIPRRIGARTDLPLTAKGQSQAKAIGRWLKENKKMPSALFRSELRRTKETADIAMKECGVTAPLRPEAMFNEIDYGPDENRTDADVIARVGAEALKAWDERGIPVPGWKCDPREIMGNWKNFGHRVEGEYPRRTVLVVTSNGIARFAPCLTGDMEGFQKRYTPKISTGALGVLESRDGGQWDIMEWNLRP